MKSSFPELLVSVERRRSELCVVAVSPEPGTFSMTARFAGGPNGVSLTLRNGEQRREFDRNQVARHPALSGVLRLIADEVDMSSGGNHGLLTYLFRCLHVYCERMAKAVPQPHWGRVVRDVRVERAVELLNQDIARRWTVELLAKAVGLSRPAFARQFLAVLGLSPMRYLTQRRMQVAAALLFASDATLAEVASRVGYSSEFAFNRAFRRFHRVPPGEYRQGITAVASGLRLAA